ncbi:MAG: dihydropteroate synthase [Clostridiales bacterium]|nr:dihydropteroate synthase [Clostridiales bacterium]
MLIIGEKLNSSIPKTLEAFQNRDTDAVVELIKKQERCGADYLDINTALTEAQENDTMRWAIDLILTHSRCDIMIDSPNIEAIKAALPHVQGRKVFINSISNDTAYEELLPVIKETGASVVCLPIAGREIPAKSEDRLKNAGLLIKKLTSAGIAANHIYIDVLAEALATQEKAAMTTINTIRLVKEKYPEVQTICGLSNISFGLPKRANLNAAFLAMALAGGLDAAILDCSSPRIQEMLYTAEALLGRDEYCMEYIGYCRENV